MKEMLNYALKEANDEILEQKEEKDQVLNLQGRMGKNNPKTMNPEGFYPFEHA